MPQLRRNGVGRLLEKVHGEQTSSSRQPSRKRPPTPTRLSASPESTPDQSEAEPPGSPDVVVTSFKSKRVASVHKTTREGLKSGNASARSPKVVGVEQNDTRNGAKRGNVQLQDVSTDSSEADRDHIFQRQSYTRKAAYGKSSQSRTGSSQRSSQTRNIHSNGSGKNDERKATLMVPEILAAASSHNTRQQLETYDFSSLARDQPARPTFTNPQTIQTSLPGWRTTAEFKGVADLKAVEEKEIDVESLNDTMAMEGTFLSSMSYNMAFNEDEVINGAQSSRDASLRFQVPSGFIRCPVCDDLIGTSDLPASLGNGVRTFREKMDLCNAHKRSRARDQWKARNYPKIIWDQLPARLNRLRRDISSLIERRQSSFYHDELERRLESGKNRQAVRNLDTIISHVQQPGYYGSKGGGIMMDHVMREYSDRIRRQTTKDRVLQLIGVSGYVQCVLVPEIACLLVRADMAVNEEEARDILKESADIGALLNEDGEEALKTGQELPDIVES